MTRIVDLRLVLDRNGRLRVHVDGRRLLTASSASEALSFLAGGLYRVESNHQLEALASALVGAGPDNDCDGPAGPEAAA